MTHGRRGQVLFVLVMCGVVPAAMAAEQGQQPSKPQAMPASPTATSTPPATVSPLEGTTWPVTVTPDALTKQTGEKLFEDALSFKNGKVTMSACAKMGFAPSTYTTIPASGSWSFTTRQVSTDQGTTRWMATFTGEAVKGTMTRTKKDGNILRYIFEGKKATTPAAS